MGSSPPSDNALLNPRQRGGQTTQRANNLFKGGAVQPRAAPTSSLRHEHLGFGFIEQNATATELVDAVINDSQFVFVPAYVFEEVRLTFESGRVETGIAEQHITDFASILHGSANVEAPTQDEVRSIDVKMVRGSPPAQAFGASTNSQPKDAPIFWNAFQVAQNGRDVTIYTTDREFSKCTAPPTPRDASVTMAHVE